MVEKNERSRLGRIYDAIRPWAIAFSIGLLAIGVTAAALDIAGDQLIEAYRRDRKQGKQQNQNKS